MGNVTHEHALNTCPFARTCTFLVEWVLQMSSTSWCGFALGVSSMSSSCFDMRRCTLPWGAGVGAGLWIWGGERYPPVLSCRADMLSQMCLPPLSVVVDLRSLEVLTGS